MLSFRSNYTNKIDAKGRVSVPSSFRAVVTEQGGTSVFLMRSNRHDAVDGFTKARLDEFTEIGEQYDPDSEDWEDLNLIYNAGAFELPFDTEGRISLPEQLIEHAHLKEQATFVGLGLQFQIWDPTLFAQRLAMARRSMREKPRLSRKRLPAEEKAR